MNTCFAAKGKSVNTCLAVHGKSVNTCFLLVAAFFGVFEFAFFVAP